jgi:integrase/recombinase XerD
VSICGAVALRRQEGSPTLPAEASEARPQTAQRSHYRGVPPLLSGRGPGGQCPARPYAPVAVLYRVRVAELCAIEVADIDLEACRIRINEGKGRKDRVVLFGRSSATALRAYLAAHVKNRYLFQTRLAGPFTTRRVEQIVKRYAEAAGVKATPHTFRHQAITWLTRHSGMADAELQLITGHAKRETLAIYQHVALDGQIEELYQKAMPEAEI